MRWFYAESVYAEHWEYGGESRDEAIAAALACERTPRVGLPSIQLSSFAVAHENVAHESDRFFWDTVAACIIDDNCLESADERLEEDSLKNTEDMFLWATGNAAKIEAALAAVLPLVLTRPSWRCIENPQEITPADREPDPAPTADTEEAGS